MDYDKQIEDAKQRLLQLGFTEESYNQLLELAAEELMDNAIIDLQDKDLALLEELERNLIPEPINIQEAEKNIELIFKTAYGEEAEDKKQTMLINFLHSKIQENSKTYNMEEA